MIVIIGTVHHFSETAAHRTMKREFLLQVAVAVKEDERHSVCPIFQTDSFFLEKSGVFLQKCEPHAGEDLISIFLKSGKTNEELNAMDCSVVARYVDDLCKSGTLKLWNFEGTGC